MADLTIQVISERRDGLLIELGRIATAHRHVLLRQRMVRDTQGYRLTLELRGPGEEQLPMQEAIAAHPRVQDYECAQGRTENRSDAAPAPGPSPATAKTESGSRPASANTAEVERILPSIAKDYPKVTPWLINLGKSVSAAQFAASMHLAGKRTGTWVYKRDFARGARLSLADAIKRIVVPALNGQVKVDQKGQWIYIHDSGICTPGSTSGCAFYRGFIEGILEQALATPLYFVRESSCRANGTPHCILEVSD